MAATLVYATEGPVVEEMEGGGMRVVVPTRRNGFVVALHWLQNLMYADPFVVFGLTAGILGAVAAWPVVGMFCRKTPRAVLTLTGEGFCFESSYDHELGRTVTKEFWRWEKIEALRKNRYGPGIYLRVPGEEDRHLLTDLPGEWVRRIGEVLAIWDERRQFSAHAMLRAQSG